MNSTSGVRLPAVAGSFYPNDREELYEIIHRSFTHYLGPGRFPRKEDPRSSGGSPAGNVKCLIVPHAGYEYSGPIAAHSYLRASEFLSQSDSENVTAILLGPNHYGLGSGIALPSSKSWNTPFGDVAVSEKICRDLQRDFDLIDVNDLSHSREHSIEVQMPFLQTICRLNGKTLSIVPISLMLQDRETASQIAKAVLSAVEVNRVGDQFLVVGSSDLTHYEPQRQAELKDHMLIDAIANLNPLEFYNVLERNEITACGYGAIATVIYLAKYLKMERGTLLKYATSGDVTGDNSSVVGYSSVEFS